MFKWIQRRWDYFVMALAWKSSARICRDSPGYEYVLKAWLDKYIEQNPIDERLKASAVSFAESLVNEKTITR